MATIQIPQDVLKWFKDVFSECNERLARKAAAVPNAHEPSFDMTFIEHLTGYGAPRIFPSGWTVKVDTHFLGGLRHFRGQWEIADIGILVHYRKGGKNLQSKAAVLQSKRLYPIVGTVQEDMAIDYEIGFGRLADPEAPRVPLYAHSEFRYDLASEYGALLAHDSQFEAISEFVKESKVPVFYQFYNPPYLPLTVHVPLPANQPCERRANALGTRIVQASKVLEALALKEKNFKPTISDLSSPGNPYDLGWRLEDFIADELLGCKQGYKFTDIGDPEVFRLFNRRSGPIASAVAFSIEEPAG